MSFYIKGSNMKITKKFGKKIFSRVTTFILFIGLFTVSANAMIKSASSSVYVKNKDYFSVYASATTDAGLLYANEIKQTFNTTSGIKPQVRIAKAKNILKSTDVVVGFQDQHHFKVDVRHDLTNNATKYTRTTYNTWTQPVNLTNLN
jgi:hypothetical protein